MNKPFIYKFETPEGHYIYDVNTNNIIKVEKLIYDILDHYGALPYPEIIALLGKEYEVQSINEGLKNIEKYSVEHHLFSDQRPNGLAKPICPHHFTEKLESELAQLVLNISERCNLRCKYCIFSGLYTYERRHSSKVMSFEVAKKAIDFFSDRSKSNACISFYGGEPLTNFSVIRKCVEYVRKKLHGKSLYLSIDTNGTLLNDEIIKFLVSNDFFIQVSIDGPQLIHDEYRVYANGRGTFRDIMKNMGKIKKLDVGYYQRNVIFAVTLAPPYNLVERHNFFSENGLFPHLLAPTFVNHSDTDFYNIFIEEIDKSTLMNDIIKLKQLYIETKALSEKKNVSDFLAGLFEPHLIRIHRRDPNLMKSECSPNGICLPGQRKLFVSTIGKFYPCERVGEKKGLCIGDVDTGLDYSKINSLVDKYINLNSSDCINCWAVRLCRLCFVNAIMGDDLCLDRKRSNCTTEKEALHNSLVIYSTIMGKNEHAFDFVKDMTFI